MKSAPWIIFFCFNISSLFSLSASFMNLSSLLESNKNSSLQLDQETLNTQLVPSQDFLVDPTAFQDPTSQYPSSDVKLFEAIPVVDGKSYLAQFLQPPNSDIINVNNWNRYENAISDGLHEDGTADNFEDDFFPYSKPNFGSIVGGFQKGGLKSYFPRHKLEKHLRHHHGLFGNHRGYGAHIAEAGAYIGDLAHLSSSLYQTHIPKFTPFPINFPSLGSADPFALEASVFKSILVPLAGVALLGAAATAMVVTNPFIWSLPFSLLIAPTTFGHFFGRRRRRRNVDSVPSDYNHVASDTIKKKIEEIKILDDFLKRTSKAEVIMQEKKVLATYLMTQSNCIDRLVCTLHRPKLPENLAQEGRVMNIVTMEILENQFVPQIIHDNILRARQVGLASGNCQTFFCHYWK